MRAIDLYLGDVDDGLDSPSEPDVPLLRKYVEWVEEQELRDENREWYQSAWAAARISELTALPAHFCDTAYCVAGKVAVDDGWKPEFDSHGDAMHAVKRHPDGVIERRAIALIAQDRLGLSDLQAQWLFDASNGADDIRTLAEHFAGERL